MSDGMRIYLRQLKIDDFKTTVKWRNDHSISNLLGGHNLFVSVERERKWVIDTINQSVDVKLAICLKENDLHIGNVCLTGVDHMNNTAESHILIGNKNFWGKGYAQEAIREILRHAFCDLGLNRVVAHINEDNIASQKMHEKCGYVKEGCLRKAIYKNGLFKDVVVMSVLKENFKI